MRRIPGPSSPMAIARRHSARHHVDDGMHAPRKHRDDFIGRNKAALAPEHAVPISDACGKLDGCMHDAATRPVPKNAAGRTGRPA